MAAQTRASSWISLVLFVLLLGLALIGGSFSGDERGVPRSVTDAGPEGRRGFYLVLQELGLRPRAWDQAPGRLPHEPALLWLPARPRPWHARETERGGPDPAPAAEPVKLASQRPEHYRRFVDEGGTLVAVLDDEMRTFLEDEFELAGLDDLEFAEASDARTRVRLATGEELEVDLPAEAAFRPLPAGSSLRELCLFAAQPVALGREELLAVEAPFGSGRVVLLADDAFLANARLRTAQHALLGVRLVEELGRGLAPYFDEFALGEWSPPGALALAAGPAVFLLSLHALALLALLVWRAAWARAFARDPAPLETLSPLERARAQAQLWSGARRLDLAARALRLGVLARLERAAGLRRSAPADEEPRWAERVERVLARRRTGLDPARARAALLGGAVGDEPALESLAASLAELEGCQTPRR